ncbi:sulfur carrier protein ThiS [Aquimarina sp. MMG016]|uniref:sulfur carrier protein ThiS n=1 Tax=Aquimarina sp. MMG016 TaxID=2822690 RepID=UPI001B3A2CC0|nr:sulfur carrier protein ThiS [Aquimarina sp. MMG016]MBQ4819779.1 sulfur carrier protein ThiS [Aquimarina sp. MMG016]
MTVNVNNQSKSILKDSTVIKLLEQLDIVSKGIAVAINDEVVSKESWDHVLIQNDDQITIIQATQGG